MQRQQWVFYPIRLNVFPFVGTNWKQSFVHQTFFPKGAAWKQTERLVAWPLLADIHKTILSPWPIFFWKIKSFHRDEFERTGSTAKRLLVDILMTFNF